MDEAVDDRNERRHGDWTEKPRATGKRSEMLAIRITGRTHTCNDMTDASFAGSSA
jgi:hypothetical protein